MSAVNDLLNAVARVGQTQKDIRTIAQTGQQLQSPEMQAQLEAVRSDVTMYAGLQITLQMIATGAMVVMAVLAWQNRKG